MSNKKAGAFGAKIGSDEVVYYEDYIDYLTEQNGGVPPRLIGPKGDLGPLTHENMARIQKEVFFEIERRAGKSEHEIELAWMARNKDSEDKDSKSLKRHKLKGGKIVPTKKN